MGLPERTVWSDGGARLSVVARIASGDSEPAAIEAGGNRAGGYRSRWRRGSYTGARWSYFVSTFNR